MSRSVLTVVGMQNAGISNERLDYGYKFKVVGMKVASGSPTDLVYQASTEVAKLAAMRNRTDVVGTKSSLLPVRASYPLSGTSENPAWSYTYEFLIQPSDTSALIDILEYGLYGQVYTSASRWNPEVDYHANISHVIWNGATWKCKTSMPKALIWASTSTYLINDLASYNGRVYKSTVNNPSSSLTPAINSTQWIEQVDYLPSENTNWTQVSPIEKGLIEYGQPYLLQLTVRDHAISMNSESGIRITNTITFDNTLAQVIFDESSSSGISDLQLQIIDMKTKTDNSVRALIMQVEALKGAN